MAFPGIFAGSAFPWRLLAMVGRALSPWFARGLGQLGFCSMVMLSRAPNGMRVYEPDGAVLSAFLKDRSHVSIIRGPLGSGTSTACCMKIYSLALEQRRGIDGKRRSKWCVIRESYPTLRNTTIRTWLDWFPPEQFGEFAWTNPPTHFIRIGDLELDVVFMSLSGEEDIQKLRSIDFTGVWFNELEFQKRLLFIEGESRTGRFPAEKDGGTAWEGVIADMNAPDETHWLPKLSGEAQIDEEDGDEVTAAGLPHDWAYFVQPPAVLEIRDQSGKQIVGYKVNPEAENLRWLREGYYEEKVRGKPKAWIDSRLRNQITFVIDGEPVFKSFNQDAHIAPEPLKVVRGHDVIVGVDFGRLRPAAVCMQPVDGRIYIQHEFRRYSMSAPLFAPELKRFLERTYAGCPFQIFGDPKGRDRGQSSERSCFEIFEANGLPVTAAPVKMNCPETRIMAVENALAQLRNGLPRFVLSPAGCPTLKAAMCGRYCVTKRAPGDPPPHKDKYSDVVDAMGYAFLGLGEGRVMIGLEPLGGPPPPRAYRHDGVRLGRRIS